MNIFETHEVPFTHTAMKLMSFLILATLLWSLGAPSFLKYANAAALTNISDTLSDSDLSAVSAHTFRFTIQGALNDSGGADEIYIDLDPSGNNFQIGQVGTTTISAGGISIVSTCTGAASEFTIATTTEDITLTICAGDTVAALTPITISTATSTITNPASATSYIVHIETQNQGSTVIDQADTRVAIIDDVVVTASVNTSFTFTVTGLATSTVVNGVTTTGSTTATVMSFDTLTPGASSTMAQQLTVSTNAKNGFVVTVVEDQNLTSSTGADIDLFSNGATTSTPIAWVVPTNTLAAGETSYGHMGVTSNDTDLNSGEFVGSKFAGNFNTARQVFSHTGPADGTTQNAGLARVAFGIEIGSLQEAGTDYTNTLTYVATPTF